MSDPAPPPESSAPAAATATFNRIEELVDELRQQQKSTRSILIVGSLVLVVIMVLFGLGLYRTVTTNLSAAELEPALLQRVEARSPELQRKATEALTLAMPTYQGLAREKMTEITPQLRTRAKQEFDQLPGLLEARLSDRMKALQDSTEAHIASQIKGRFDTLTPERIETLSLHLTDEFHRAGMDVQNQLEDRYTQQLERLEATLAKFDIAPPAGMSDEDLQLKLIENAALLVVHLTRNPDELPTLPTLPAAADQEVN